MPELADWEATYISDELIRELADPNLLDIIAEVQRVSDDSLWNRILNELDPSGKYRSEVIEFIKGLLELREELADYPQFIPGFYAIHVALHNVLGCDQARHRISEWQDRIPCTRLHFKVWRFKDMFYLDIWDENCPFAGTSQPE